MSENITKPDNVYKVQINREQNELIEALKK